MEIRILGPLDVRIGENQVLVRPGVHRLILTLLALRNGATVGTDVLAELIWGHDAPTKPTNALHSQISHLRRALQPLTEEGGQVLVTVPGGYLLDVPTEAIDAARFEVMVAWAGSMVRSADRVRAAVRRATCSRRLLPCGVASRSPTQTATLWSPPT